MKKEVEKKENLHTYRTGKLTVLQLLSLLALAGVVATLLLKYFF
jgi:hypothetical protein